MNHKIEVQNEEQKENTYVYLITFRPLGRTISEKRTKNCIKMYPYWTVLNFCHQKNLNVIKQENTSLKITR